MSSRGLSRSTLVLTLFLCLVSGFREDIMTKSENDLFMSLIRYPRWTSLVRKQAVYGDEVAFPCQRPISEDPARPQSVHTLRPQDVSVVGAMGDSLVAGNGALEEWVLGSIFEYRGVSWCAGGDSTWREVLTLPNILKEFNPRLTGFSTKYGEYRSPNSRMNIGYPIASAEDALLQAKILVNRMKRDPKVNFNEDWKMVTIFFGANDACSLECFNNSLATPAVFVKNLQKGLDYLQENLPRTFVNLVSVIDVTASVRVKRSPTCQIIHPMLCLCLYNGNYDHVDHLAKLAVNYQRGLEALVNSGRYDTTEDFTVVTQPFMKLFNLPSERERRYEEVIDTSYVTHDCFHFSQKGHAIAANLLWNNLLEPVGNKSTVKLDYIMQKFKCPSEMTPYFFTARNTKTFFATGHQ